MASFSGPMAAARLRMFHVPSMIHPTVAQLEAFQVLVGEIIWWPSLFKAAQHLDPRQPVLIVKGGLVIAVHQLPAYAVQVAARIIETAFQDCPITSPWVEVSASVTSSSKVVGLRVMISLLR